MIIASNPLSTLAASNTLVFKLVMLQKNFLTGIDGNR